jgi:hypothetical protein
MAAPAAGMSAAQRMSFLMGGGQARGGAKKTAWSKGIQSRRLKKFYSF